MADSVQFRFLSPLRYPGGKGKVANYIKLLFLRNGLVGHTYLEPYAGGASVALALLFEEYASRIHINDINRSVHAFWDAVLNDTDNLCARIRMVRVDMEEWGRQRAVQEDADATTLDLAFSTFFLNRTNRSGIISGGVIGGKGQGGQWKLDARFNREDLVRRIESIALFRNRITLTRLDAAALLQDVLPTYPDQTFAYLDPPYFVKGEGLYENSYRLEDHAAIAALVRQIRHPWLVSYDATHEIMSMYAGLRSLTYRLAYSAADRYRGCEAMFFSAGLIPPDVDTPANVPARAVGNARMAALR